MGLQGRRIVGRYLLHEVIGNGGMATVYRARDMVLDRDVAVKVMDERLSREEEFVKRFFLEARANGRLSQPNIVNVYDAGRTGKTYYMVMELINGITLKELIEQKGGRISERSAIMIAMQICDGLYHAHQNGIIHRDVKPQNILQSADGRFKLTDFGIARLVRMTKNITQVGHVMGSIHYFSPEQAMGKEVTSASDVYSLGIVLYEMVTGKVPFDAPENMQIAFQHINRPVPNPQRKVPELSDEICQVIYKALEKDPRKRYQTAKEMKKALQSIYLNRHRLDRRKKQSSDVTFPPTVKFPSTDQIAVTYPKRQQPKKSDRWKNYVIGASFLAIIILVMFLVQSG